MARVVVLFPAVILLVAGCGPGDPTPVRSRLPLSEGSSRLVERVAQRSVRTEVQVTVPAGATDLQLRVDCRADPKGAVSVALSGFGSGGFECGRRSGGGLVVLGGAVPGGVRTVTVTASAGVTWSAAADVR